MLRILHVVTDMGRGGLETMIMNYYRRIDRNQVQFDFLMHRYNETDFDKEIESLGGKIYRLPRLNPFSIKYRKALRDFFKNNLNYNLIHVHQDCLSSIIMKEAKLCGVEIRIAHSHSSSQNKDFKYLIKMFYRQYINKYATELMACSKKAGDWMFNGAPYKVLNNAIDAEKFIFNKYTRDRIREELNVDADTILIGHVGRFSTPKNHLFLVDIFYEIQKKVQAKLVLVGDGVLRDDIVHRINEYDIMDKVIFTGICSNVCDYLQAMDVFVFPSIYEGLPLTIVEAQASGLPCIISDKVPIECKKTDIVYQIQLNEPISVWVDTAIKLSKMKRKNTYADICKAGFDVESNAEHLVNYYHSLIDRL